MRCIIALVGAPHTLAGCGTTTGNSRASGGGYREDARLNALVEKLAG